MEIKRISDFLLKWDREIGLGLIIVTIISIALDYVIIAYALVIFAWIFIALWLLKIVVKGKSWSRKPGKAGLRYTINYSRIQRIFAGLGVLIVTVIVWGWIGLTLWNYIELIIPPKLSPFPVDKYGIIVSEITKGSKERNNFLGGADIREKITTDINRLIIQHSISDRVEVQESGIIINEKAAYNLGDRYGADLVIWGYVPSDQPNVFRPSFTIINKKMDDFNLLNPTIFNIEVGDTDTFEANEMLTNRVTAVSSFMLGMVFLNEGQSGDYERAIKLLSRSIREVKDEAEEHGESESLRYNLSLFHLIRGRAHTRLEKWEEALLDFQKALLYFPDSIRVYTALGNLYYEQKDYDTSEIYYQKALPYWRGTYGIGLISYQRGEYTKAIENFENALSIARESGIQAGSATDIAIQYSLGLAYKQSNDSYKAQEIFRYICESNEHDNEYTTCACRELTITPTTTIVHTSTSTISFPKTVENSLTSSPFTSTITIETMIQISATNSPTPTISVDRSQNDSNDDKKYTEPYQPKPPQPPPEPPPPPYP